MWFRVLTKLERGIVDLTIRCVDRVRSTDLALIISRIVCKVLKNSRSGFLGRVEKVGRDLAERISRIAVGWGCALVSEWKRNPGFVRFLGVNAINSLLNRDQI